MKLRKPHREMASGLSMPVGFKNATDSSLQGVDGNVGIAGLMVESYLEEGNQKFPQPLDQLKRGVSITDACIDWKTPERILRSGYEQLNSTNGAKAAMSA